MLSASPVCPVGGARQKRCRRMQCLFSKGNMVL
jgi:hypothetical protein